MTTEQEWPEPFAALRGQLHSQGEYVRVFETWTQETKVGRCTRLLCTGLLDPREAENLQADAQFGFDVEGAAPESPSEEEEDEAPEFRIWSSNLKLGGIEPLILSWESNQHRVSIPDPGFLLTYKLNPRLIAGGQRIEWDNPGLPEIGVARGVSSGRYDGWIESESFWEVKRSYIQDYASLRGKSILVSFFELWRLSEKHPLAGQVQPNQPRIISSHHSSLRYTLIPSRSGDGTLFIELRGFQLIASPGPAPITVEDYGELKWPGIKEPIIHRGLECNAPTLTFVHVRDQVLEKFAGKSEYSISPESGAVALGAQWAVGYCHRYGRDLIRLEIRKLYEGTPAWVVRHYHSYCVEEPEGEPEAMIEALNIAKRAKSVCDSYLNLGQSIHDLLQRVGCNDFASSEIIKVSREDIDYSGWWSDQEFSRLALPVGLDINEDMFLARAKDLYKSTFERMQAKCMRRLLKNLRFPKKAWSEYGSIRCLVEIVALCRSASELELQLPEDAKRARTSSENYLEHSRPLLPLQALNSLRQLDSHHHGETGHRAKLAEALDVLGVDSNSVATGYGLACDALFDQVTRAMEYSVAAINELT